MYNIGISRQVYSQISKKISLFLCGRKDICLYNTLLILLIPFYTSTFTLILKFILLLLYFLYFCTLLYLFHSTCLLL